MRAGSFGTLPVSVLRGDSVYGVVEPIAHADKRQNSCREMEGKSKNLDKGILIPGVLITVA